MPESATIAHYGHYGAVRYDRFNTAHYDHENADDNNEDGEDDDGKEDSGGDYANCQRIMLHVRACSKAHAAPSCAG